MPDVNLDRASNGITEAFEDRNIASIAGVGVVSAVGASISAGLGSWGADLLGLDPTSTRAGQAATGLGAAVVGVAAVALLGSKWGGPFAIGSTVVVGLALLAAALGPVDVGMNAQQMLNGTTNASPVPAPNGRQQTVTASGCTSCGNSHGNYDDEAEQMDEWGRMNRLR